MFIRNIRLNYVLPKNKCLKQSIASFTSSKAETSSFLDQIRENCTSFTPQETISVSNQLDQILKENPKCSFSPHEIDDIKKKLSNNIRFKLYSLPDLKELCKVTSSVLKAGLLTQSYSTDFLSRLDKLIVSANFEDFHSVCECLILLHGRGQKVDGVCIKFYNILISDNLLEKVDNLALLKVFETCVTLKVNNKALDRKIDSEIKDRVKANRMNSDTIISLVRLNNYETSKFYYLNPFLVSKLLKDQINFDLLVACMNNCKNLSNGFERIDELYLKNKDNLKTQLLLDLLNNFSRFKYKPFYLNEILEEVSRNLEQLKLQDSFRLLKNTYELNTFNKAIIDSFCSKLRNSQNLEYADIFSHVLLAMSYFALDDVNLYNSILYEIIRNESKLKDADKINLQILYTVLTNNGLIDSINPDIKSYLHNNSTKNHESRKKPYMEYLSGLVTALSHTVYEQVNVGGYYLDFVGPRDLRITNFNPTEHGIALLVVKHYRLSRATSPLLPETHTQSEAQSQTHSQSPTNSSKKPETEESTNHSIANTNNSSKKSEAEEYSKYLMMKSTLKTLNVKFIEISWTFLFSLSRKNQLEYLRRLISNSS